ncbi:hypothetical protein HZA26_03530, partial [Candidatus Nomurabacteria bacterium]|nr:hypothetical protein [Candidatus Nomurabacteria bacterium]
AYRINSDLVEKVSWDQACIEHSQKQEYQPAEKDPDLFTDRDLREVVAQNPSGVIYLWTPHTPCALKGLRNVIMATQSLGVKLFPVLDPASNRKHTRRIIRQQGFPIKQLREVASFELIFRGLTNHHSGLLVFSNGEIKRDMLRGPHNAQAYIDFIKERLQK